MIGNVRLFNSKRGYGYITGEDGRNYFVHRDNIHTSSGGLVKGYAVEFTPTQNNHGFEAEDVIFLR